MLPVAIITAKGEIVIPVDMVPVLNPEGDIIGYQKAQDVELQSGLRGREQERVRYAGCDLVERAWS